MLKYKSCSIQICLNSYIFLKKEVFRKKVRFATEQKINGKFQADPSQVVYSTYAKQTHKVNNVHLGKMQQVISESVIQLLLSE